MVIYFPLHKDYRAWNSVPWSLMTHLLTTAAEIGFTPPLGTTEYYVRLDVELPRWWERLVGRQYRLALTVAVIGREPAGSAVAASKRTHVCLGEWNRVRLLAEMARSGSGLMFYSVGGNFDVVS